VSARTGAGSPGSVFAGSREGYRVDRPARAATDHDATVRRSHYLHPGQVFVAVEPTVITTILGSCVSVCLHDPRRRIGGVNHFLLPNWAGHGRASARFGNVAVESLVDAMLAAGCSRLDLKARLFGGSHLLPGPADPGAPSFGAVLGARNVEIARSALQAARIEILHEDVGGRAGRKLTFVSDDGTFRVKTLQSSGRVDRSA
jgi:chemotaxis protein CheD